MGQRAGCVLFSSHIMQEVAALCDRLVIIVGGKSVFVGSIEALRQKYPDMDLEDAFVDIVEQSSDTQIQRGTK